MLNYVAIHDDELPARRPDEGPEPGRSPSPRRRQILPSARLPPLLPDPQYRVHWGFVIALLAAVGVWWLLQKSTLGFEIRTVGANPHAARYAGIAVGRTMVVAHGALGWAGWSGAAASTWSG